MIWASLQLFCHFASDFMTGNFSGPLRKFWEKADSSMVMPSRNEKIQVFRSFSLVYISLVGSVTISSGQIEWS